RITALRTTRARSRSRRSTTASRERGWQQRSSASEAASRRRRTERARRCPGGRTFRPPGHPARRPRIRRVDATAYLAPYAQRRVRRPLRLSLTEHSYPLEPWGYNSWLAIAVRAFARLAVRIQVEDLLIVGTGNCVV